MKELALATRALATRETDAKAWAEYTQARLASNELVFVDWEFEASTVGAASL